MDAMAAWAATLAGWLAALNAQCSVRCASVWNMHLYSWKIVIYFAKMIATQRGITWDLWSAFGEWRPQSIFQTLSQIHFVNEQTINARQMDENRKKLPHSSSQPSGIHKSKPKWRALTHHNGPNAFCFVEFEGSFSRFMLLTLCVGNSKQTRSNSSIKFSPKRTRALARFLLLHVLCVTSWCHKYTQNKKTNRNKIVLQMERERERASDGGGDQTKYCFYVLAAAAVLLLRYFGAFS